MKPSEQDCPIQIGLINSPLGISSNIQAEDNQSKDSQDKPGTEHRKEAVELFVGGLKGSTHDIGFEEYFAKFGKVVKATIIRGKKNKCSAGYGFISIHLSVPENQIFGEQHIIDGNEVDCQKVVDKDLIKKRHQEQQKVKLFIGGLPKNLPDIALKEYFEKIAPLKKAYVVRDFKSGKTRGFAFVIFESTEGVKKVLDSAPHSIEGKQVHIKASQSKSTLIEKKMVQKKELQEQEATDSQTGLTIEEVSEIKSDSSSKLSIDKIIKLRRFPNKEGVQVRQASDHKQHKIGFYYKYTIYRSYHEN